MSRHHVSFPDRLTPKGRLLRVRSGHAEVEIQRDQIVGILKDAESGVAVADLLRKYGVSRATFFEWRVAAESSGRPRAERARRRAWPADGGPRQQLDLMLVYEPEARS